MTGASDPARVVFRLACFLPVVAAPFLTNWICTTAPVERWLGRGLDGFTDLLIAGKTIWTSDDLRSLKAAWIARMPVGKDVLILGSSRALPISSEWFQPLSMFNAAVFSGDMDDMISIFQLCVEAGKTPRVVVLELNPALTNEAKAGEQRALEPYFRRALARYRVRPPLRLWGELFSALQFRLNLRRLRSPAWGVSREPVAGADRLLPDGVPDYGRQQLSASPDLVEANVALSISHFDRGYIPWRTKSQPDGYDLKLFRCFLDDVQSRGIRVVVWLAPIHPAAYDFYAKLGGYDETWIRREMASRSITVVGSYSPATARATNADFFDDVHPRAAVVHRLFREAGVVRQ
jgi:hypothetical protein